MIGGKVNFIIDGQWGSTGKGKLAGYLALRNDIRIIIANFMPNAGHTWVDDLGKKIVSKMIPNSAINKDATVYLSPNSLIDVDRLLQEVEVYGCLERLVIHPNAAVLTPEHKAMELKDTTANAISSTLQGCGAAISQKVRRSCQVARENPVLKQWVRDFTPELHSALWRGETVLMESAQGFDLSLNWGREYPFTTSRDITIGSLINDAGINHRQVGNIYGCIRSFPIRVGNVVDKDTGVTVGHSGPCYSDQRELTWDEITKSSGSPEPLLEKTTVTQKVRRIFTLSHAQLIRFLRQCAPTHLFVNFANYWDWNCEGIRSPEGLKKYPKVWNNVEIIDDIAAQWLSRVAYIGTGAEDGKMVELHDSR